MLRRALFIASLCLSCKTTMAQQHVHGEGQLLIAQQLQQWQFQFILPAADMLGFEHVPESAEQKQKQINFIRKVEDVDEMIRLPKHCKLLSMSHSLQDVEARNTARTHFHANAHKREKSVSAKHIHVDISITYRFNCTDNLDFAMARVLEWENTLQTLDVQWVTEAQQGAIQLKPLSNILRFKP